MTGTTCSCSIPSHCLSPSIRESPPRLPTPGIGIVRELPYLVPYVIGESKGEAEFNTRNSIHYWQSS